MVTVGPDTDMAKLPNQYKWLTTEKLVVKPDQLIKRRGKNKLILVGANYDQAKAWIEEKTKGPITIYGKFDANGKPPDKGTVGQLTHFIIEPMVPHKESDECYVAIMSTKDGDTIMFYHQGGVNVGDVDAKAARLEVPSAHSRLRPKSRRNCWERSRLTARSALQASSRPCSSSTRT